MAAATALTALAAGCGTAAEPAADEGPTTVAPAATVARTASGGGASPAAAPRPSTSRPTELRIAMGEWAIAVDRRAVRPGPTTLVITNRGKLAHGFELKAESGRGRGRDRLEIESRVLQPGETLRLKVDLPQGLYEFECFVADHDDLGMEGSLEARPGAAAAPRPRPRASGSSVPIEGFAYRPRSLTIAAGQSVTWVNRDSAEHTVTESRGAFASERLTEGGRYTRRFPRAGRFTYLCALHPGMRGDVVVRP
jgi:plastocyanin